MIRLAGINGGMSIARGSASTPPAVSYILDTLGLVAPLAVSTRKLKAAYVGSCMRVRRSSDNIELDIGFTAGGDLDTAALLAHTGANSGFVTAWYDQSGGVNNLTQAVAASQLRIVNAGVVDIMTSGAGKPAMLSDGVASTMPSASVVLAQPLTRSSVLQFVATTNQSRILQSRTGVPNSPLYFNTDLTTFAGINAPVKAGVIAGNAATVFEALDGAASSLSYNGIATTTNPGAQGIDGVCIGNDGAAGFYSNVRYMEVILFSSALNAGNRVTLETSQKAYFGTP